MVTHDNLSFNHLGTGGTFHGTGKYIKEHCPDTKIILAEPGAAAIIGSGFKTERNADGSPQTSHPAFQPHPIQGKNQRSTLVWFANNFHETIALKNNLGWTPDFIPLVLEKGLDLNLHDELVNIPDGAGVSMAQSLAKCEGILTGISGGATMWAAVETAKNAPEGSVLVAMIPDTGERYLSTPLFASISADMNEEELAIARSTPSWILEPWDHVRTITSYLRLTL
jgi:cysteine synthase A